MPQGAQGRVGGQLGVTRETGTLEPEGAEAVARRFARAMLDRDPRRAAGCFAAGARILTADGTEVSGHDTILSVLRQITSSEQSLEIRLGRAIVAEGVASCTQFWRRTGPHSKDQRASDATIARLVLLRNGARWEIVIASPWE
jgi:ketosteroid isomerase-like protein